MPRIVYDVKTKRPGCVLLQVAMGGDPNIANKFPSESWIVGRAGESIKDLKLYDITDDQLNMLIRIAEISKMDLKAKRSN